MKKLILLLSIGLILGPTACAPSVNLGGADCQELKGRLDTWKAAKQRDSAAWNAYHQAEEEVEAGNNPTCCDVWGKYRVWSKAIDETRAARKEYDAVVDAYMGQ